MLGARLSFLHRHSWSFDAELKALGDKARGLKSRKVQQLGELVIATGADTLSVDELAGALIVLSETKDAGKREAWSKRGAMFFQERSRRMHRQLTATRAALRRHRAARDRHQAARARHDMRTWQIERRKRTRHLIELGGLVVKAGIVELTGDDRATIYGALLWMGENLKSDQSGQALALWGVTGKQAFEADRRYAREGIEPLRQFSLTRKGRSAGRPGRGASFSMAGRRKAGRPICHSQNATCWRCPG